MIIPNCQNAPRSFSTVNQPKSFFGSSTSSFVESNLDGIKAITQENFKEFIKPQKDSFAAMNQFKSFFSSETFNSDDIEINNTQENGLQSLSTFCQPKSFSLSPLVLNLDEIEAITLETFKELFTKAQDVGLPYYLVTVVQLTGNVRKIYDTIYFRGYLTIFKDNQEKIEAIEKRLYDDRDPKQLKEPSKKLDDARIPIDPSTRLKIEKIQYFAIDCFDEYFYPILAPSLSTLCYNNYFDPKIYDMKRDENVAIDALDYYILSEGKEDDKNKVKDTQLCVIYECQRAAEVATEVAKLVDSFDEILNIDAIDHSAYADSDDDMWVEFGKKNVSSNFLEDMHIEFKNPLVSSGGFSPSSFELLDLDISSIPVAGMDNLSINTFEAESSENEITNDSYESEDELDLGYESEEVESEHAERYLQELFKWKHAYKFPDVEWLKEFREQCEQ